MNIFKIFVFVLLFFNLENSSNSVEIKNLASINNKSITNVDLIQEIKIMELLENIKIKKNDHSFVLQKMIRDKIKAIEIEKNKISIPEKSITNQYDFLKKNKLKEKKIPKELEKLIMLKIENTYKWNKLVNSIYSNKLAINIDEIEEIMKSQKIPENKRNQIIKIEKNKKLNTFSKTHFNKIKKKYLVKKY